jgi:lysine 2,3-aminomutase
MKALRGFMSGLCVPHYMIDLPGGGGKVPLLPEYVKRVDNDNLVVENYQGKKFSYH